MLEKNASLFRDIGARLRRLNSPVIVTCGRGSSDHAAGYFKYLTEIMLGIPVASLGPSLASVYAAPLQLQGAAMLTISQSGLSPDIIALQKAARHAGALTIAIVNSADSPIACGADCVVPLHAGLEQSVAATKTFLASCAAGAALVAEWAGDGALSAAVQRLPETLHRALAQDWSAADVLVDMPSLYVLARGPGLPIAGEAALKLKETASLHAEAYSMAEVMHGPLQLIGQGFPVLSLVPDDRAADSTRHALTKLVTGGASVFTATTLDMPGQHLPVASSGHGLTDPISMIQSFYRFAERLARLRGHNPDTPARLRKVTETF